jgi:hypothetical protein
LADGTPEKTRVSALGKDAPFHHWVIANKAKYWK